MYEEDLLTAYVVLQQKSLDDDPYIPWIIKWLLRRIYEWYGWAAVGHDGKSYCKIEFVGIFDNATEARWAAMIPGGSYRELPLNASLPEGTCQFRIHDFPHASVSQEYRDRKLPFTAVPTKEVERLHQAKCFTDPFVEAYKSKSA
jgi:hypothetical protein